MKIVSWVWGSVFAVVMMSAAAQTIYKWTDAAGNVHFSDKPQSGAQQIQLPPVQTFSSPQEATPLPSATPPVEEAGAEYQSIQIVQPTNEATIRNNLGYVPIVVEVKPELKKDDKLQLIFDGKPLGSPQANTIFALNGIDRGMHTIAVNIVDSEGNVLSESAKIIFYLHRATVATAKGRGN